MKFCVSQELFLSPNLFICSITYISLDSLIFIAWVIIYPYAYLFCCSDFPGLTMGSCFQSPPVCFDMDDVLLTLPYFLAQQSSCSRPNLYCPCPSIIPPALSEHFTWKWYLKTTIRILVWSLLLSRVALRPAQWAELGTLRVQTYSLSVFLNQWVHIPLIPVQHHKAHSSFHSFLYL